MNSFIRESWISEKTCQNLIELFKHSTGKTCGTVGIGQLDVTVSLQKKISTECSYDILHDSLVDFSKELQAVLSEYITKYSYCNAYSAFTIKEPVKIQHYNPNEGFMAYHTERGSCTPTNSCRHLVFMTYLNTVTDQGGTEFYHQGLITTAVQGKTIIWPADWTHTHRGVVSPTQEKYIITGWYSFI